jgi:hypothetical protein
VECLPQANATSTSLSVDGLDLADHGPRSEPNHWLPAAWMISPSIMPRLMGDDAGSTKQNGAEQGEQNRLQNAEKQLLRTVIEFSYGKGGRTREC